MTDVRRRRAKVRYAAKKASYAERSDIALVLNLSPADVYKWMEEHRPMLEQTGYIDFRPDDQERVSLEYCLFRRNDPFIDLAIAKFGGSTSVISRVFKRANAGTRLAAIANRKGSIFLNLGDDYFLKASRIELEAFFSNPEIDNELFIYIFNRANDFRTMVDERLTEIIPFLEKLPNERLLKVIPYLASHPRLLGKSSQTFLDDDKEYDYQTLLDSAWKLAGTVPVTNAWGLVLGKLLEVCNLPGRIEAPRTRSLIERWSHWEDYKEGHNTLLRDASFLMRSALARLLRDEELVDDPDIALRLTFYGRFDPKFFPDYWTYLKRDGEEWRHVFLNNENLWKTSGDRSLLRMNCGNTYADQGTFEKYEIGFRKLHPEWFIEEKKDLANPEMDLLGDALTQLLRQSNHNHVVVGGISGGLFIALVGLAILTGLFAIYVLLKWL